MMFDKKQKTITLLISVMIFLVLISVLSYSYAFNRVVINQSTDFMKLVVDQNREASKPADLKDFYSPLKKKDGDVYRTFFHFNTKVGCGYIVVADSNYRDALKASSIAVTTYRSGGNYKLDVNPLFIIQDGDFYSLESFLESTYDLSNVLPEIVIVGNESFRESVKGVIDKVGTYRQKKGGRDPSYDTYSFKEFFDKYDSFSTSHSVVVSDDDSSSGIVASFIASKLGIPLIFKSEFNESLPIYDSSKFKKINFVVVGSSPDIDGFKFRNGHYYFLKMIGKKYGKEYSSGNKNIFIDSSSFNYLTVMDLSKQLNDLIRTSVSLSSQSLLSKNFSEPILSIKTENKLVVYNPLDSDCVDLSGYSNFFRKGNDFSSSNWSPKG